jgi:hypothetical protein
MEETLSKQKLKELVEHTIDRRMEVWLAQLTDALVGMSEEELPLQPEFATSLRLSLEQAWILAPSGSNSGTDQSAEELTILMVGHCREAYG